MTDWPNWKPNTVLTAAQLVALEDYLLTPWRFAADFCAGVDSMRPDSIAAKTVNESLTVSVRNVCGVTAGRCPILVSDSAPLEALIRANANGTAVFDAILYVNDGVSPTKLSLELKVPDGTTKAGEQLWLGRFGWDPAQGLRRMTRPPVRRLGALRDDPDWAQWVAPVAGAVKTLTSGISPPPQMQDSRLVASAAEIHRLRFEWPTLTIVALWRTAQFLSWLGKSQDDAAPNPVQPEDSARLQEQGSDTLPQRLASFLVESVPAPSSEELLVPERDYRFTQHDGGVSVVLLRALPAGSLEFRFPAGPLAAGAQVTINAADYVLALSARAVGAELRVTLPARKASFPKDYRFEALSNELAVATKIVLELWFSKK